MISGTNVITTLPVEGHPWNVDVNSNTGYVYVINKAGYVTVILGTDVIATLSVGREPEDVTVNPATGYAYVANWFDSNVSVIGEGRSKRVLYIPLVMKE